MTSNASVANIVALVESDNNKFAVRFEPGVYAHICANERMYQHLVNKCSIANKCTHETSQVILSTSYGKYQDMGFNIYSIYVSPIGSFMASDEDQDALFGHFLSTSQLEDVTPEDLLMRTPKGDNFAKRYNGPGDVANYGAKLQKAAVSLGA
jgi:hypothetical protein